MLILVCAPIDGAFVYENVISDGYNRVFSCMYFYGQ